MAPPPWPSNPPPPVPSPAVVDAPTHHHHPVRCTDRYTAAVCRPLVPLRSSPSAWCYGSPLIASILCFKHLRPLLLPNSGHDAPPKVHWTQSTLSVSSSAVRINCRRMLKFGNTQSYYADLKYDGERLIGFKMGKHYKFFSRNMLEVPVRKLGGVDALLDATFGAHRRVRRRDFVCIPSGQ